MSQTKRKRSRSTSKEIDIPLPIRYSEDRDKSYRNNVAIYLEAGDIDITKLMTFAIEKSRNDWLAYYLIKDSKKYKKLFTQEVYCDILKTSLNNLKDENYRDILEQILISKNICPETEGGRSKKTRRIKKSNRRSAKNKL